MIVDLAHLLYFWIGGGNPMKHIFVSVLLFTFVETVSATTVYNNFGIGDTFQTGAGGYTIGGSDNMEQGELFTPLAEGFLTDIYVAAYNAVGPGGLGEGSITFSIYSDSNGIPGAALEAFLVTGLEAYGTNDVQHMVALGNTYLTTFSSYWLIASQPNSGDNSPWYIANPGHFGTHTSRSASVPGWDNLYQQQAVFRVEVAAVPAPATIWLFGLGLIGLLAVRGPFKRPT